MIHGRFPKKNWMYAALVIMLIAAHGVMFYHVISRLAWSVILGLALLILLKHIGLFGPIYAFLKRRSRL